MTAIQDPGPGRCMFPRLCGLGWMAVDQRKEPLWRLRISANRAFTDCGVRRFARMEQRLPNDVLTGEVVARNRAGRSRQMLAPTAVQRPEQPGYLSHKKTPGLSRGFGTSLKRTSKSWSSAELAGG